MPRNTPAGFVMGVLLGIMGFALVWHIWWMAAAGLLGAIATIIVRSCNDDIDYWVPAAEVQRIEELHRARVAALEPQHG
jgi:cytochrome o ubiquinol oxidase subunit 1